MLPLGEKARAILNACTVPAGTAHRSIAWQALEEQFSAKAVRRKTEELIHRGYLVPVVPVSASWLTDKGRHALESHTMRV